MQYVSTNRNSAPVSLTDAINCCIASDGGMFMPQYIPRIPRAFFNNINEMTLREIAYVVASSFLGDDVDAASLKAIVDDSFSFDAPLIQTSDDIYVLELFHGPTLTFKDYGARFMARLLKYLADHKPGMRRNVLVATTGNTGAAAANGLLGIEGITVSVLYPKGCLSRSATAQFASLGGNIHPVEIMGSVEDCKRLVQSAIGDPSLSSLNLTGANSINIARLIPQVALAMHAYASLLARGVRNADKAIYSMPCGNAGNVVAATMATMMGMPAGKIIGATNANNQLAPLLNGTADGRTDKQLVRTLAPSIDMTYPSGWPRLKYLFNNDLGAMRRLVEAYAATDDVISATVGSLRADSGYTIDPHGAVAYSAAVACDSKMPKVVFATGHPAKQLDIMTRLTASAIELPVQLTRFMGGHNHTSIIPPTLPALKKHLMSIDK